MSLKHVADAFWTQVQDPEIADVLFEHAGWLQRNEHAVGPTDQVAARHYKGELAHTVAVARSENVDPEILRKFAKDTRVSVRQELLENPSTPRDVLVELTLWKLERRDHDSVACLDRLSLTEAIDTLERFVAKHGEYRRENLDLAAHGLVEKLGTEPALALKLVKASPTTLVALVAKAAHHGNIPGVSLSDVLDARPDAAEKALHVILTERRHLTKELATRWRAWRDDPETRIYRHFGFDTRLFDVVEDGAADILVGGDVAQLHTAILHGATSSVLADAFPACSTEELRHVIDVLGRRELCARAEKALVDRVLELAGSGLGKFHLDQLMKGLRHRLDDERLIGLLRAGGVHTLHAWLGDESSANGPRPGILPVLARTPRWHAATNESSVDLNDTGLVGPMSWAARRHPRIALEVIAIHDTYIGQHLSDRSVAAMVYPILEAAFTGPEKRASWETFLTLASDWSDTFTGLLAAVYGLLGITPEVLAGHESEHESEPAIAEQLTLL